MNHQLTYSKPSPSLIFKAWVAERLERSEGRLWNWLINDLVKNFDKRCLIYSSKIQQVPKLSKQSAQYKLINLEPLMRYYEKLDVLVSDINVPEVQQSFKALKKTFYSYEAKLRVHVQKDTDVLVTPDYIRKGLSEIGKKSIDNSLHSLNGVR